MATVQRRGVKVALLATVAACALAYGAFGQDQPIAPAAPAEDVAPEILSRDDLFVSVQVYMPRPRARPAALTQSSLGDIRPKPRSAAMNLPAADPASSPAPEALVAVADIATAAAPITPPNVVATVDPVPVVAEPQILAAPEGMPPQIEPVLAPAVAPMSDAVATMPLGQRLPLLATIDVTRTSFKADRAALSERMANSEDLEQARAAVELARVMVSQMLLPEARSYLGRAIAIGVQADPALVAQTRALQIMVDVLDDQPIEAQVPEGWDEASLWAIAGMAKPGQIQGDVSLGEAISQLGNHSPPVVTHMLPKLFDAAMLAEEFSFAEGLLQGARKMQGLYNEPVYLYMMGRLALAYDLNQQGFDYFVRASAGHDLAAQRARIALTDIALKRNDYKVLPALRDILKEGVNQWRHGYEALILRARLAQVAEDLGDMPLALSVMGNIRIDHPGTAEAVLAHERGALAMAAFAAAMDADEIDLPTYLYSLRDVESFYRLDPIWPVARMALARAFSRHGLHEAAAAEFAALQNDLGRVGAPQPIERIAQEIPLAEAEEWLVNHRVDRAKVALAREGMPRFDALGERYAVAAMRAGTIGALAMRQNFDQPENYAVYAKAARDAGQSYQAMLGHRALESHHLLQKDPAEALYAVMIAHDEGDNAFASSSFARLREAAPEQAADAALYSALITPQPVLTPLSKGIAKDMLTRSDGALEAARALLSRGLPRSEAEASAAQTAAGQSAAPQSAAP